LGIDLQPVSLAFHYQGIPPSEGEQGVSLYAGLHGPKRRESVLDLPGGTVGAYPQDPPIFMLHPTASRGNEAFFIEIRLGQGDVAVIEGNPILETRQQPEKSGQMAAIPHLQIQHIYLLPTPEVLLPSPSESEKKPPLPQEAQKSLQAFSSFSDVDMMSVGIL
jgi:hypothetical protein